MATEDNVKAPAKPAPVKTDPVKPAPVKAEAPTEKPTLAELVASSRKAFNNAKTKKEQEELNALSAKLKGK